MSPRRVFEGVFIRPHPSVEHPPGAEYAVHGDWILERRQDAETGRYSYRRALAREVPVDASWLEVEHLWEPCEADGSAVMDLDDYTGVSLEGGRRR